ncbi:thiamine biosynthesis protein ThiH [Vibrio sp. qd031]|uniref:2-iminoacetate synthase ThiH n=1 Tax=Vibrio sp. qd031 TaxID=1603038 RepID=UPI000A11A475|nr:2-iminoacetate synthase ThiH [Vibrio sp. qd031]ORT48469.1 thiamine biosynthesis protein ThiH [Vibrio sp. qd031]
MAFVDEFNRLDPVDVQLSILSKTKADVERALSKSKLDTEDFKALISPAAEAYIEPMAQRAYSLTRRRFGHTISLYIPLYLSNLCANACTYCGFSMENKIKRKTLNTNEIEAEMKVIKSMGFDSLLLVTGEHQTKVGMNYFRSVLPQIKEQFSYLAMEVQPLDTIEYEELKRLGLNAVMVYQETYNRSTYAAHHLRGAKMDFDYRLGTPERLASAGIDKVGLGALIGLDDWRTDCYFTALHLNYLERHYWKTRYSISFPRLRPCEGSVQPKSIMNDKQLVQLICAYRLLNPELELSLSTREEAEFRDKLVPLGITSMSAASKTQPGGYANSEIELEQFEISDERSAKDVAKAIERIGFQPVWKDWHCAYS